MSEKPKILFVCDSRETAQQVLGPAVDDFELVFASNPMRGLAYLTRDQFEGVYVSKDYLKQAFEIGKFLQNEQILDGMPDGVVLLDSENAILWANAQVRRWSGQEELLGANFYSALGSPEILGPDFCPFHTALATGKASSSTS